MTHINPYDIWLCLLNLEIINDADSSFNICSLLQIPRAFLQYISLLINVMTCKFKITTYVYCIFCACFAVHKSGSVFSFR